VRWLAGVGNEYAVYGLISRPGSLPGAAVMSWMVFWTYAVELGLLAALLTLFPTGRPPSRRWRWILWAASIAAGINVAVAVPLWPQRGVELLNLYGEIEVTAVLKAFTTSASSARCWQLGQRRPAAAPRRRAVRPHDTAAGARTRCGRAEGQGAVRPIP